MKAFVTGLLKGRKSRWGMLAVLVVAGGLSVAWLETPQYRLGGSFIGTGGGILWNGLQTPLDPAGRKAAARLTVLSYDADIAGLLAALGADTVTECGMQIEMISQDKAKYSLLGYYTKQGNPPLICAIVTMTGTLQFTGPDNWVGNSTLAVYPGPANALGLPNADADADGFPDLGTTPFLSVPNTTTAKRVTVP